MKQYFLILALIAPLIVLSQTKKKETIYVLFDVNNKETYIKEDGSGNSYKQKKYRKETKRKGFIDYSICDETFIFNIQTKKTDIIDGKYLKKIKLKTFKYLMNKYLKGKDFRHHLFEKIYFIEKISKDKMVKREVFWAGEWIEE